MDGYYPKRRGARLPLRRQLGDLRQGALAAAPRQNFVDASAETVYASRRRRVPRHRSWEVPQVPWVRLDDSFPDHPKIAAAGPFGGWLHVCGLCYCNRHLTDGFIPASVAHRLMDADTAGLTECSAVAEDLCERGLWHKVEGGYEIHDYLDYQPSRADVEQLRAKKKAAGQAGGQASAQARAQAKSNPKPKPNTKPLSTKPKPLSVERPEERVVYDHWRTALGKTDSRYEMLSAERRTKIQARLKDGYTVEQLCKVFDLAACDDWPERSRHSDITVLLRSREKVDAWLDRGTSENGSHESGVERLRRAMAERGIE